MSDKKISCDNSNNQISYSSTGTTPLPSSAGQTVTAIKGGVTPAVHGQVPGDGKTVFGPVFDNPGQ